MILEISFDDAHRQDLRALEMVEKHGLRAMLYVPAINRGHQGQAALGDADIRDISTRHDIGFHSWSHPHDLKAIEDTDEIVRQVTHGRAQLEQVIGRPITSFCYPRGKYDERATRAVRAAGYADARTVDVGCTSAGFDPFRKPTTVHVHPRRKEYGGEHWVLYARRKLEEARRDPHGYFHLWGHGWEVAKFDLWSELDEVLAAIKNP